MTRARAEVRRADDVPGADPAPGVHRSVQPHRGGRRSATSSSPTAADLVVDRAGDRERDRAARAGHGRRRGHRDRARDARAGAARAVDERQHVEPPADAGEPARGSSRSRATGSSGRATASSRAGGPGRAGSPSRRTSSRPPRTLLSPQDLAGERVVVTRGPDATRRSIRSRFVGNRSSGKMGIALAAAAQRRGADGHAAARAERASAADRRDHDQRRERGAAPVGARGRDARTPT